MLLPAPGDFNAPIVYQVDRSLDVTASPTAGRRDPARRADFHMAASFQKPEEGLDHQISMPAVPQPEELPDRPPRRPKSSSTCRPRLQQFFEKPRPFASAWCPLIPGAQARAGAAGLVQAVGRLPDDERLHRCLLAYASTSFCSYVSSASPA